VSANTDVGAWIVAVYKVVSQYSIDDPALDPLEAIVLAGRAADLFSAVRACGRIDADRFEIHRKLARIRPSEARRIVEISSEQNHADVSWSTESPPNVKAFEFCGSTNDAVLEAAGDLYPRLDPTPVAGAILGILQSTLPMPKSTETIREELHRFEERTLDSALQLASALGLVSVTNETSRRSPLVFNPRVFDSKSLDAFQALQALNADQRQQAQGIVQHVYTSPGVPFPKGTDPKIVKVLIRVGLIDYSKITTRSGKQDRYFPTAPNAWGVLTNIGEPSSELSKDLIDDAKVFLNSLRYGQYYSDAGRGKILSPYAIVNALLRDKSIGASKPATAIGEDYPLALSRGIVNIVESRTYPGRYSMELLKDDVASAVKDVIASSKILPVPTEPSADEIQRAGQRFISPGAVRAERELPSELKKHHDELVFQLRTMRRGR